MVFLKERVVELGVFVLGLVESVGKKLDLLVDVVELVFVVLASAEFHAVVW